MPPRKSRDKIDKKKMLKRLTKSSAYRVAYRDPDFLGSYHTRPARLQMELLKTEVGMQQNDIKSTIVVFGGTRIVEVAEARRELKKAQTRLRRKPNDTYLKRHVKARKAIVDKSAFYDEARKFGQLVSSECLMRDRCEYVIVTGGGPGVMEAANRGAYDSGAKSIGLNITLPLEQAPNPYISPELCFQFHYFAIRKMHFLLRAKALIAFPGGYGTLDELFEGLTLLQTKKIKPLPIILFGEKFWRRAIDFDFLVDEGVIAPEDIKLFVYVDRAEDAWNYIKTFYISADADFSNNK